MHILGELDIMNYQYYKRYILSITCTSTCLFNWVKELQQHMKIVDICELDKILILYWFCSLSCNQGFEEFFKH